MRHGTLSSIYRFFSAHAEPQAQRNDVTILAISFNYFVGTPQQCGTHQISKEDMEVPKWNQQFLRVVAQINLEPVKGEFVVAH